MTARAPLTLIVGMHRSGTSLLGSLLPACGIAMPGPLIDGDTHNPEGYFERADITALQEQLLIDLDRWWPAPEGCQPLPADWLQRDVSQQALAELIQLLDRDSRRQSGPWAIKDPRSSLLLPLWRAACDALALPLNLLLAVRDPAEVCVSLSRRDQALTGMNHWRAQGLWWQHNAQVLLEGQGLPLQVVSFSHWFDPAHAEIQLQRLAPACSPSVLRDALRAIHPEHRRSLSAATAARCCASVRQLHTRLEGLALQPHDRRDATRSALEHWLRRTPAPAMEAPRSSQQRVKRQLKQWAGQREQPRLTEHPWYRLAVLVNSTPGAAADHQLAYWIRHGFRPDELERFSHLPAPSPTAEAWAPAVACTALQVRLNSAKADHWSHHAWLQHCPIDADQLSPASLFDPSAAPVALNLWDPQPGTDGARHLLALAALERVWDPCQPRVQLLRRLGIRASWLQAGAPPSHPRLQANADDQRAWQRQLGLPAPTSLGAIGSQAVCLGRADPAFEQSLKPPLVGIPSFDGLAANSAPSPGDTRLLAQWLQNCLDEGLPLVRLQATAFEQRNRAWQALVQPHHPAPAVLMAMSPLGAGDIIPELTRAQRACDTPLPCPTPTPAADRILEHQHRPPELAVCISLYNYAEAISAALESVAAQTIGSRLELIVVDDQSTDDSLQVARQWLEAHSTCFARTVLIRHTKNGGLAAARNTAFQAATSPWCFVLDADNQLHPEALEHCGGLARAVEPRCAVVYPIIEIRNQTGGLESRHLVSERPWDQAQLAQANYIDAMALIRRQAWEQVGGYTHIPGGWEDYDFWCKLIDAHWHGVQCPQVLATYTSHAASMRATSTNRQERQLRRLLQQRHPWLNLIRQEDVLVWPHARPQRPPASGPCEPARPA